MFYPCFYNKFKKYYIVGDGGVLEWDPCIFFDFMTTNMSDICSLYVFFLATCNLLLYTFITFYDVGTFLYSILFLTYSTKFFLFSFFFLSFFFFFFKYTTISVLFVYLNLCIHTLSINLRCYS